MTSPADPLWGVPQTLDFLRAMEAMLPAYRHGLFSYVALCHEGEPIILHARLHLTVGKPLKRAAALATATLRTGQAPLDIGAGALQTCIRCAAASDWLPLVEGQLLKLLPKTSVEGTQGFSAYHDHADRSQSPTRCDSDRFVLSGTSIALLTAPRSREIDREIRELGLDSLHDLMRVYDLRWSEQSSLEVTCEPVATLHGQLEGRHANLDFTLAKGLRPERFRVTVRNADPNTITIPSILNGTEVDWIDRGEECLHGQWTVTLPTSAVINCWAVYAGRLEAAVSLADRHSLPNERRMTIDLVDPELTRLRALLTEPSGKQRDDFESAVALLFQLLGFAPAHIGAMSGWTHEPDILVSCPSGETLVVECTTDVPDDGKLTLLVSRVARLRELLGRSREGAPTADPIAMLVTPRPAEELAAMRRKAEEHGVIVLSRAEIEAAISQTEFQPNPDSMLAQWRRLSLTRLLTGE